MSSQILITHIPSDKKDARNKLLRRLHAPKGVKAIILLDIADQEIAEFLKKGQTALSVVFIDQCDPLLLLGVDAVVTDREGDSILGKGFRENGVVPIFFETYNAEKIFSAFDPMKFTGNAFLYKTMDPYAIFMEICRFMENTRYPGDYRLLLKNLSNTVF